MHTFQHTHTKTPTHIGRATEAVSVAAHIRVTIKNIALQYFRLIYLPFECSNNFVIATLREKLAFYFLSLLQICRFCFSWQIVASFFLAFICLLKPTENSIFRTTTMKYLLAVFCVSARAPHLTKWTNEKLFVEIIVFILIDSEKKKTMQFDQCHNCAFV